jgi:zinc transporter ZupT
VSVAYVFVHLLPEVEAAGRAIRASGGPLTAQFELHAYLLALAGFISFYGLEQFVTGRRDETETPDSDATFWVHVASFGAYNALIGYLLLAREQRGLVELVLFGTAMGTHFLVNDYGLVDHHGEVYRRQGRWVLAVTVLVGAGIGLGWILPELFVAYLLAFLAGSIVLNVIKEELPADRESRFLPFAGGAVGYALLLVVV